MRHKLQNKVKTLKKRLAIYLTEIYVYKELIEATGKLSDASATAAVVLPLCIQLEHKVVSRYLRISL
jgi:hypothetical protein